MLGRLRLPGDPGGRIVIDDDDLALDASGPPPAPGRESVATRLVRLALASGAVLGSDGRGRPWMRLGTGELLTFADGGVSEWLRRLAYGDTGRATPSDAVAEARDTLAAQARYSGIVEPVYVRVAPLPDGGLALDMGTPEWTAAVVRAAGWALEPHPVNFARPPSLAPLPTPIRGGSVAELAGLLNLGDGEEGERRGRLVVAFLVASLRATGPYLGLAFAGPAGSAKTHGSRIVRQLIDPTPRGGGGGVGSLPRSEDAFASVVSAGWLPIFDNLSGTTAEQADWLCQLSTGYATSRRKLYTDDGSYERSACRPFVLTGIDVTDRDDLTSRLLIVHLPELESGFTTEDALYAELDRLHPAILGGLLDALVSAVAVAPTLPTRGWPNRMADATRWVTGAEPALGWPAGWFSEALRVEQASARANLLADKPWYAPLVELLADRGGSWEGAMSELLAELKRRAEPESGRLDTFAWPKSARGLREALDRHVGALRAAGIRFEARKAHGARTVALTSKDGGDDGDEPFLRLPLRNEMKEEREEERVRRERPSPPSPPSPPIAPNLAFASRPPRRCPTCRAMHPVGTTCAWVEASA